MWAIKRNIFKFASKRQNFKKCSILGFEKRRQIKKNYFKIGKL